jgi:hypothetical protein
MKNFIPAASFLTLGAASLAITNSVLAEGASKPWAVRAALSGFYNDNVYTRSDIPKQDSFGFEVSPGFSVNLPVNDGQTTLTLSYDYVLRYFDNRAKSVDHNHLVEARLVHQFNTRNRLDVFDNFAQAQEPQQLGNLGGNASQLLRAEGTNFRNIAGIDWTSQLTERWSSVLGFRNNIFRFEDVNFQQSLDRTENYPSLDLRYQLTPATTVGVFYQYGMTDFDGPAGNVGFVRDFTSHFIAATADHDFSPNLKGSLRAGIQINEFEKAVGTVSRDGVTPYIDGMLSYDFAQGSTVSVGVRHQVNVTDVSVTGNFGGGAVGDPIRGSSATSGRLSLTHSFTPKLIGSVSGIYQYGTFIGGGVITQDIFGNAIPATKIDGASDSYASVDMNLSYKFTHYLSGRLGYAHDRVDSDLDAVGDLRVFSRNRVYLGVNFTY